MRTKKSLEPIGRCELEGEHISLTVILHAFFFIVTCNNWDNYFLNTKECFQILLNSPK